MLRRMTGFAILGFLGYIILWAVAQDKGWKEALIGLGGAIVFAGLLILAILLIIKEK